MRILHILDHSLPLHSGYAFRTVAILREQRALGWETIQLTTPRHGAPFGGYEDVDGWRFHRSEAAPGSRIPGMVYVNEMQATARAIERLVREYKPHVLHAHSPVLTALPALRVGRRYGLRTVYEVRAFWEDAAVDHGATREGSVRYRLTRALETYALRRVDHVTTICHGLRDEIVARGIDPARVTVIPNAVDADKFVPIEADRSDLRRRLGLEGATVLGFVGSFYAYEGLDLAIEALPKLVAEHPSVRLLLVGGGSAEPRLKALASKLGVADRVVFAGRVPQQQVQPYYDLIDILVYARHRMRLTELVTPLKPLEAMAMGRMLVASDVGGHRELVRDGVTGFLFEAGNVDALAATVSRVLAERSRWPAIRAAGREFVERERTWTRSVASYVDVYGLGSGPSAMARSAHTAGAA